MNTTKVASRFLADGFAPAGAAPGPTTAAGPIALNHTHGTKRLASCREELERSWQGGTAPTLRQCVSSDGGYNMMEDAPSLGYDDNGRAKRRRTLHPIGSNENDAMMTDQSFARGIRISPTNRPDRAPSAVESRAVKAGWYEGQVDAQGNRHGRGVTKHDDGTDYEGPYVRDVMEGDGGSYKFFTERHLVPNPRRNGSHLHRQVEKLFVGSFTNDLPDGPGMVMTKVVDCAPQVLGSTPLDVRFVEVTYDVGMHKETNEGKAVGEGVRIIYTNAFADGRSTLKKSFYRLLNGEMVNIALAEGYAKWMLQCMEVDFPTFCPSAI